MKELINKAKVIYVVKYVENFCLPKLDLESLFFRSKDCV